MSQSETKTMPEAVEKKIKQMVYDYINGTTIFMSYADAYREGLKDMWQMRDREVYDIRCDKQADLNKIEELEDAAKNHDRAWQELKAECERLREVVKLFEKANDEGNEKITALTTELKDLTALFNDYKNGSQLIKKDLQSENADFRAALEIYASGSLYSTDNCGDYARAVLSKHDNKETTK